MALCPICSVPFAPDVPSIECTVCSKSFHPDCVGLRKRTFQKLCRPALNFWECFSCKNVVCREDADRYRTMLDDVGASNTRRCERRTRTCEDMAVQVETSNQNISQTLNYYQIFCDTEKELLSEFKHREREMSGLQRKLLNLKYAVNIMTNPATGGPIKKICIGCISEDDPRDVLTIVRNVAKAINVEFDETKITSARFHGPMYFQVTRSVCIKFKDPKVCQEWLQKYYEAIGFEPNESVKLINYSLLKK